MSALADPRTDVFWRGEDSDFFDFADDYRAARWADDFLNNFADYGDASDDDEKIEIAPGDEEQAESSEVGDWLSGWVTGYDKAAK